MLPTPLILQLPSNICRHTNVSPGLMLVGYHSPDEPEPGATKESSFFAWQEKNSDPSAKRLVDGASLGYHHFLANEYPPKRDQELNNDRFRRKAALLAWRGKGGQEERKQSR